MPSAHPGAFRYLGYLPHLRTTFLEPPLRKRFFDTTWSWRVDTAFITLFSRRRPYYTIGLFFMECRAALHMLWHRSTLYHAVKADVDLLFTPWVSRATGNFMVATFHEPPETFAYWRIDSRLTRYLAGVILLGESQRAHFDGLVPPGRVFVVPLGVDTTFFTPGEPEEAEELTCITVGSHLRDATTLMAAMEAVWRVRPQVRLLVVGTRRKHDPNPPPQFDDERVEFLDDITDEQLRAAYRRSRVMVLSLKNAVGNTALLEAMACGLPVVATHVGAVPEYVGTEAGILAPPGDPDALAAGMLRLLEDPRLARQMGAAGRARVLRCDHKMNAQRHDEIYSTIRALENGHSKVQP
jgi:glycosyltransferase involved in cell wall biosynthesis